MARIVEFWLMPVGRARTRFKKLVSIVIEALEQLLGDRPFLRRIPDLSPPSRSIQQRNGLNLALLQRLF